MAAMLAGAGADRPQTAAGRANAASSPATLAADRMQRKLEYIEANGRRPQPDRKPTQLTEEEVNAYFAAGRVKLPKGVHQLRLTGQAGRVTATAEINFDEVKEGRASANPLLAIFSGTHPVRVESSAAGNHGRGSVHVESVEIDGIPVPRMALEFFADRYLKPKYPNVGLDTTFALPDRTDTAVVGEHVLTLVQK